jgi:hypothetical protein
MDVNAKMVTGDQMAIARETAGKLGLGTNGLDASGFGDTKHNETAQLAESIEKSGNSNLRQPYPTKHQPSASAGKGR